MRAPNFAPLRRDSAGASGEDCWETAWNECVILSVDSEYYKVMLNDEAAICANRAF